MRRALAVLGVLGAPLASAAPSQASFAPKLVVSSAVQAAGGSGPTRIGVALGKADDQAARVAILVPSGYQVATAPPGPLGAVAAAVSTVGGAILPLTGELDAVVATPATNAIAAQCQVTPSQTWALALAAEGRTLSVPLFVAASPVPGYAAELVACFPPEQSAPFGAKVLSATLTVSAIAQPSASGDYRWASIWTPYGDGTATPSPAGTVQVQSLRRVRAEVSIALTKRKVTATVRATVKGKRRAVEKVSTSIRFTARITTNGAAPSSARITTTAAGKKVGGASGAFLLAPGKSATLVATAVVDSDAGPVTTGRPAKRSDLFFHDLGASGCALVAGLALPCTDATIGGETVTAATTVRGFE
ncbi:MAG: hypothetical protein ACJ77E_13855 [Gaiellaceae bacterium]